MHQDVCAGDISIKSRTVLSAFLWQPVPFPPPIPWAACAFRILSPFSHPNGNKNLEPEAFHCLRVAEPNKSSGLETRKSGLKFCLCCELDLDLLGVTCSIKPRAVRCSI